MCKKLALGFIAATLVCSSAIAQEVTLRAVTAFAEKTTYSRGFEKFIERVNAEGKGKIQINYIGGPKAMPPFEVGKALQSGVIDIANTTGAFTTNVIPEGDAWKLTEKPMSELRKNGGYDYMTGVYKSGEISRIYDKWFLKPVPPKGVNLNVPMGPSFKKVVGKPTDSGDPKDYQ